MRRYLLLTLIINFHCEFVAKALDLKELRYYEIVVPYHVDVNSVNGGRYRRDLSTFVISEGKHLDETVYSFSGHNRNFLLHIYKNHLLIPNSIVNIHQDNDGNYIFNRGAEHCYYHGYLRDRRKSSVAVSTCYGLNGVVKDEDDEEFVIEPHPDGYDIDSTKYVLYKSRDVIANETNGRCGVEDPLSDGQHNKYHYHHHHHHPHHHPHHHHNEVVNGILNRKSFVTMENGSVHHRSRRAATSTKYVETTVVIDNKEFTWYNDTKLAQHRGLAILNFVDSYYKTMNTRVVVTNMIVWNVKNMANVTESAGETLDAFEDYTRDVLFDKMKLKMDNAQLISNQRFTRSYVGLAGIGNICSRTSAAVNKDHASAAHETANTVAHEMGHNIGFMHYKCDCPNGPCVMSGGVPSDPCKGFAPCTRADYATKLEYGDLPCLLDYPAYFFQAPKCGNGLLEQGETCDCGSEIECIATNSSKCCDFATCKLKPTAQCSQGDCCDDCMFKPRGFLCRKTMNRDCDLEEYCTGSSNHCPSNSYIQDGSSCRNDTAYCYHGTCKTHDIACEMLWGPTAMKAEEVCFNANLNTANQWASCGKNKKGDYVKCAPGDQLCGKLQCRPKNKTVKFPTFPIIGHSRGKRYVTHYGSKTITCIQGKTTVSADLEDPTITGPGIKCAKNSICLSHRCINISSLSYIKKCDRPCLNGGVCNNHGHCHCAKGYACPYCEFSGPGGSEDSGQGGCIRPCIDCISDGIRAVMYVFLLVIPLIILTILFICRYKHHTCCNRLKLSADEKSSSSQDIQPTKVIYETPKGSVDNPYIITCVDENPIKQPPKPCRPPPAPPHSQLLESSQLSTVGC